MTCGPPEELEDAEAGTDVDESISKVGSALRRWMTAAGVWFQPAAIARHHGVRFGIGILDVTPTGIVRIVAFADSRVAERFAAHLERFRLP